MNQITSINGTIEPAEPTKENPFAGLTGVDEMFAHVLAEHYYKPFEDTAKQLFANLKVLPTDQIQSLMKSIFNLGVSAGRAIEKREIERNKK